MARSKVSLTRSLPGLPGCSCARSNLAHRTKISANAVLRDIVRRRFLTCDTGTRKPRNGLRTTSYLKSESRLITHGDAIEHVARRGSVSLGAFIKTANRLRPENLRSYRRCEAPLSFRTRRHRQSRRALQGNTFRLRLLINLQRNDCGTDQDGCDSSWIRGKRLNIQPKHETMSPFETDAPQRLAKHFIALPAMKFMEEILEITGWRLFIALQSKQPRDFVLVKLVHFSARIRRQDFSEIRPDNSVAADSRRRASNVPSLLKHARSY